MVSVLYTAKHHQDFVSIMFCVVLNVCFVLWFILRRETYNQIESQFLAAKLNLHQITEKKEMLTEHLCTIISHNEDRKAKKLSELLDKVGLNDGSDSTASLSSNDTK